MSIKIQSNIDYLEVCKELGIEIEDLLNLVNHKKGSTIPIKEEKNVIEVIDEFLLRLNTQREITVKSETSIKYYKSFLLRLKDYLNSSNILSFNNLNADLVLEVLNYGKVNNKSYSQGTINTYFAIMRKLISFAYEQNYITKDIRYRFIKGKYYLSPKYFSNDQIKAILSKALNRTYGYRWRAIFITLLGTGLRVHELVNLKVRDFNIENNLIYTKGKGGKERYVPIYPEVKKNVLDYLKLTGVKKWDNQNNGYLFTRDYGVNREKKISIRSIQYQFENISNELQLEKKFSVHSFRHTFAVNCLKVEMRLEYLSQILGHESPKTTSIYTQLLPIDLKSEITDKFPFPIEKLIHEIVLGSENE